MAETPVNPSSVPHAPHSADAAVEYGLDVRTRLAVSEVAAELVDIVRRLVPTNADGYGTGYVWIDRAGRAVEQARELFALAVAYERQRGASWEEIGEALGISKQAAHERYAAFDRRLTDDLIMVWLLGDDVGRAWRFPNLSVAATAPADRAPVLDRWVLDEMRPTDTLANFDAGDPERSAPVSFDLLPMSVNEHAAMVIKAERLLADYRGKDHGGAPLDDLERGYARRKVELYERVLAEADVTDLTELFSVSRPTVYQTLQRDQSSQAE